LVISGAGLDTLAYRNPYEQRRLHVIEVDHPATQRWKCERLAGAPFQLFFDPVELVNELGRSGFSKVEDLGADELNARYFKDRTDNLRWGGGMGRLISAVV
jgi:O-methyltransferase involved in polyketide biosynthesis